jgi:hypothetical protein
MPFAVTSPTIDLPEITPNLENIKFPYSQNRPKPRKFPFIRSVMRGAAGGAENE